MHFLENRDQGRPFFLNVSFHRPHAPLDPPKQYRAMYKDEPIPPVPVGDWAARHDIPVDDPNAWHGRLSPEQLADARRSYYALITHIDTQIGRFRQALEGMNIGPTWFLFTSDHGEMLGDHNLFRKTYAYEGSAGIPMIITPPEVPGRRNSAAPVSQIDIMPTLLEAAGLNIPESVEGRSMLPLLDNSPAEAGWRDYVHGEHSPCYDKNTGMQFLTDGREKYIWYTLTGEEQLFDLAGDPDELHNLADEPACEDRLLLWRSRMVSELAGRAGDGLSDGNQLISGIALSAVRDFLLEWGRQRNLPGLSGRPEITH
ncbi:MAG: sulfatase-like hydrolase/transferase [Lentisphaeria bacterium]|nr:sulfatase-like hydrolase/transferase [Lentisphaeria bacterium]